MSHKSFKLSLKPGDISLLLVFVAVFSCVLYFLSNTKPPKIPHTVISESVTNSGKRSVDIRVPKKISEHNLKVLAKYYKDQERSSYRYTYIHFYLPGMEVGSGAWATANYEGDDMKVSVNDMIDYMRPKEKE